MTSNPRYADAFQFTAVELRDTKEEKENSDFVVKNLKMAYVKRDDDMSGSLQLQTDEKV